MNPQWTMKMKSMLTGLLLGAVVSTAVSHSAMGQPLETTSAENLTSHSDQDSLTTSSSETSGTLFVPEKPGAVETDARETTSPVSAPPQDSLTTSSSSTLGETTATVNADSSTSAVGSATTSPVVKLPSGVTYQLTWPGAGPQAGTTATLLIHYTLYLADGTKMESSREKEIPKPFEFTPGTDTAIKGMDEGTAGMKVGERRRLNVPANMAYGDKAHGKIPPHSRLIFDVELVDVKKAGAATP